MNIEKSILEIVRYFKKNFKSQNIKCLLWTDRNPRLSTNSVKYIDVKKIQDLPEIVKGNDIAEKLVNNLLPFIYAKSKVNQAALAADMLRFIVVYLYGGFYIDCGYKVKRGKEFTEINFEPFNVKNVLRFSLSFYMHNRYPIRVPTKKEDYYIANHPNRKSNDKKHLALNLDSHFYYSCYSKNPIIALICDLIYKNLTKDLLAIEEHNKSYLYHYIESRKNHGSSIYPGIITNTGCSVFSLYNYGVLDDSYIENINKTFDDIFFSPKQNKNEKRRLEESLALSK